MRVIKLGKVISHDKAIKFLKGHGLNPTDQTETLGGLFVTYGSSFYDNLGKCDTYRLRDVKAWLGY